MTEFSEPARQAAHALLDTISVREPGNVAVRDQALQRINSVGAARATWDDDTGRLRVNIDDLFAGTLVVLDSLLDMLTDNSDRDRKDCMAQVRELVDRS